MNELTAHLGQYTVIWPNSELVEIAARIRAQREQRGRRLHLADAWIAATAAPAKLSLGRGRQRF